MNFTKWFEKFVSDNISRDGINDLMSWLSGTDFYIAPASTKYHLDEVGGLCEHSVNVYKRLRDLCEMEWPDKLPPAPSDETIAIVALFHDLCKANYYKVDMANRKGDDGKWKKVPVYVVDERFPIGHGEKSLYLVSKFLKLTDEEALSIRWHMGAWGISDYRDLDNAMRRYPLVTLTQMADISATYLDER